MERAKLCVTVTADTTADLRARREQVEDADLIELRLDTVRDPSAAGALAGRRRPVIVTCRPAHAGGWFRGSEEERHAILRDALALGAEFVDVEWQDGSADLLQQTGGRRVVLSHHDFRGMPADLPGLARAMRATGAEVVKIAATASRLGDCLALRALGQEVRVPMVLVPMGDAGVPGRVLAGWMGSRWTYAGHGSGVAPGQIPADRLCGEFGFRRIGSHTAIYGVLGRPVSHSVSPAMHNAAFRDLLIDAVYLPLAAADFQDFLVFAEAVGLAGASVTAPFKVDAFERADEADAVSRRVRSVNTLRRVGHRWAACNTDVSAFLRPIDGAFWLRGARAVVLGAGGAARSVAAALSSAGAQVTISARRADQAQQVAALTGAAVGEWPPPPGTWDLLVNATSAGTAAAAGLSPLPDDYRFDGRVVYDLIYSPPVTRLLADAARAGCRTIGGLDMLVAQALAQFEWWTGRRPAERVMRDAALARLTEMEPR